MRVNTMTELWGIDGVFTSKHLHETVLGIILFGWWEGQMRICAAITPCLLVNTTTSPTQPFYNRVYLYPHYQGV